MSQRTDKKIRATARRRAAKKAAMAAPGARSKYALKLAGTYPAGSPYNDRWAEFRPMGAR